MVLKFPKLLARLLIIPETQDFFLWDDQKVWINWLALSSYVNDRRLARWKTVGSFVRQLNLYGLSISFTDEIPVLLTGGLSREDFALVVETLSRRDLEKKKETNRQFRRRPKEPCRCKKLMDHRRRFVLAAYVREIRKRGQLDAKSTMSQRVALSR